MQDMSRVNFPRIPRTVGEAIGAVSGDASELAKCFRIDPRSIDSEEVLPDGGSEPHAEPGDAV